MFAFFVSSLLVALCPARCGSFNPKYGFNFIVVQFRIKIVAKNLGGTELSRLAWYLRGVSQEDAEP